MSSSRPAALALAVVLGSAVAATAESPADHWAWKVPVRPAVPAPAGNRSTSPIDAFVRARLVGGGLKPASPASREALLRRASFDLTGLPPSPAETESFVRDNRPNAWEAVLDRLLASPHYGERWGRHWLDLARYADTNGFEHDEVRPHAWRYRDYVVRSLNADKPYDRFVLEQLAGDELAPDDPDALIATGFNLLGPDMVDSSDQVLRRHNALVDMTDTAGLVFLGLTLTCARCHDHKFEPLPAADYYRFQAFFAPAAFRKDLPVGSPAERAAHEARTAEYRALTATLREEIARREGPPRTRLLEAKLAKLPKEAQKAHRTPEAERTGGQQELAADTAPMVKVSDKEVVAALPESDRAKLADLKEQLKAFDPKKPPAPPAAMGLADGPGLPAKTFLLERGELSNRAGEVRPGFPAVLVPSGQPAAADIEPRPGSSGRRLALAKWIASAENPLTARVLVNRLWQHHFGCGIVATTSDFGVKGERPTHPELLDWLAGNLVAGGWRLKPMHKLMMLSETYVQSSDASASAIAEDPANALLSHANRHRLEGEAVRDALLAIGGRLNLTAGGPGVIPPVAREAIQGAKGWVVSPDPRDHVRRSIYLFVRRTLRHPFLEAFDQPDSNLSCPRREQSTTAPQALALLDAAEVMEAAKSLAARLGKEGASDAERIERAYRRVLGRSPSPAEAERARLFLRDSPLTELCRALFNLNEFVYVD